MPTKPDPQPLAATARAVWQLASPRLAASVLAVRCHAQLTERLGARTAAWAYADNRRPTFTRAELSGWEPTLSHPVRVLSGPVGCGKTVAAARWTFERGGAIVTAAEVERWPWTGGKPFAAALGAATLMVDDLGIEGARSRGRAHLVNLVNARADAGLTTIITTNLPPDLGRLRSEYPDQFTSRVWGGWVKDTRSTVDLRTLQAEPLLSRLAAAKIIAGHYAALDSFFGEHPGEGCPADRELMGELMDALDLDARQVAAAANTAPPPAPMSVEVDIGGPRGVLIPGLKPLACSWCTCLLDQDKKRHPRTRGGKVFCSTSHRDSQTRLDRDERAARLAS